MKYSCHLIGLLTLEPSNAASSFARAKLPIGLIRIISCLLAGSLKLFVTLITSAKLAFRSRLTPTGGGSLQAGFARRGGVGIHLKKGGVRSSDAAHACWEQVSSNVHGFMAVTELQGVLHQASVLLCPPLLLGPWSCPRAGGSVRGSGIDEHRCS